MSSENPFLAAGEKLAAICADESGWRIAERRNDYIEVWCGGSLLKISDSGNATLLTALPLPWQSTEPAKIAGGFVEVLKLISEGFQKAENLAIKAERK